MRITSRTPLRNVALLVGDALMRRGIRVVLTGGACATIYSEGRYASTDIDFIVEGRVRQADLDAAMTELGFSHEGDRYIHSDSTFWVEFPRGPLAVGGDYDIRAVELRGPAGRTFALSPTDSCRDRLAAFYHWGDRQSLVAAVEIASRHRVNLRAIRAWSHREGHPDDFLEFRHEVERIRSRRQVSRRLRARAK